jgi:trehalose 6-phosphate synthase/phosphatase
MKVLWQYRDADTEFGSLQAKELEDHLSKYLRSFSVDILHGGIEEGGYVEVRPKGVNKGVLAMRVIKHFPNIAQKDRVDFALVLGDDHCDEPMLSVMRQVGRRVADARRAREGKDPLPEMPATIQLVDVSSVDNYVSSDLEVFTCTVGKKPSAAASYLHDVDEVQELFESLVKVSTRDQRYYSSVDLRTLSSEHLSTLSPTGLVGFQAAETVSVGLPKSQSLGEMKGLEIPDPTVTVSTNLNDFLGTIEDDEEEDIFF